MKTIKNLSRHRSLELITNLFHPDYHADVQTLVVEYEDGSSEQVTGVYHVLKMVYGHLEVGDSIDSLSGL